MFDWRDDICCCASKDCLYKDDCIRSIQYYKQGIHTVSDFTEFCKNNNREYYIKENDK